MGEPDTTTLQVTYDVWGALDRRKQDGETFDDVIRRLINQSPAGMGELKQGPTPDIEYGETVAVSDEDGACAHFDPIDGQCEQPVAYKQQYRLEADSEWRTWCWCKEHAPDGDGNE